MKEQLTLLKKRFSNHFRLKLVALGVAVLLWLVVVANINPNYTHTISGVGITLDDSVGLLSNVGLHVIEKSNSDIKVEVAGPRSVIGRLKASDFIVKPDVSPVTKAAKYSLRLSAALKYPNPQVKIVSISPKAVDVKFDLIKSKTLPVRVNVSGSPKLAEGFILINATTSPATVTVTGAAAEIDQITSAQATVNVDDGAKDTVQTKGTVQLLDSSGNPLALKNVSLDDSTVNVTVPILKSATRTLSVDFTNVPSGFDLNNISASISPAEINIAGEPQMVDAATGVKIESIDFSTLNLTTTVSSAVILPSGLTNVDNLTSASVTVNLLNTATKLFSTSNISVINVPAHYGVTIKTKQVNNIEVFGPSNDIGNLSILNAVIDMSSVPIVEGQYEVPVTIEIPGKTGYWVKGNYTAAIYLWKKR